MASHWRAALHKAADLLENPKAGWCQGRSVMGRESYTLRPGRLGSGPMPPIVRRATDQDRPSWDEFVASRP